MIWAVVKIGLCWDNGKNESWRDYGGYVGIIGYILGLCWDNETGNGNYHNIGAI